MEGVENALKELEIEGKGLISALRVMQTEMTKLKMAVVAQKRFIS